MKYLSDYVQEAQTALFKETGAFFAFSPKQFKEQRMEGRAYVHFADAGMFCFKECEDRLCDGLEDIQKEGIRKDMEENGKKDIIHRELGNHEVCITYDITDTIAALEGYPITREEIAAEFPEYLQGCKDRGDI